MRYGLGMSAEPDPGTGQPELVRRTYLLSREVADALRGTVDEIHYGSLGKIPKNQVYDAIITAGLAHADTIKADLLNE